MNANGWLVARRGALLVFALLLLVPSSGCVGVATHLMWVIKGRTIPAEYKGLAGQRVAVVCVSQSGAMGPGTEARMLAQLINANLAGNVDKIDLVHPDEIADWMDNNEWDQIDYREVGRGVRADMVLAVELDRFRLYNGTTLFQGHADVKVSVLDMSKNGLNVFPREIEDFTWPASGGRPQTEMSENRFRRQFVSELGNMVSQIFYEHDMIEGFSRDAAHLNSRSQ